MVILFDITSATEACISIDRWLNISVVDIMNYVRKRGNSYSDTDFLEYFKIPERKLLVSDLLLTSLHVVTNNDKCESIRKYGLRNLQDVIQLDTPLGNYIRMHGINIDFREGTLTYKDKKIDISRGYEGFSHNDKEKKLDMVKYKLFDDYQINAFFCDDNVLDYAGYVSTRPEFLCKLTDLFGNCDIEYDWERQNNEGYVIKFKAHISKFADYRFDIKTEEYEEFEDEPEQIELIKRKWILEKALAVIWEDMFYDSIPEIHSFMRFNSVVPIEDIIHIWTAEEYKKEFKIGGERW